MSDFIYLFIFVCISYIWLADIESDAEGRQPEKYALEVEEAGLAISAASRLLAKLLDSQHFCEKIYSTRHCGLVVVGVVSICLSKTSFYLIYGLLCRIDYLLVIECWFGAIKVIHCFL
jgi:hypothetical protein